LVGSAAADGPVSMGDRSAYTEMGAQTSIAASPSLSRRGAPGDDRGEHGLKRSEAGASSWAVAALDQRIGLRYAMPGMDPAETAAYVVGHHLELAGRADTLFSDDAVGAYPPGEPGPARAVNNLAVQSLVAAFADNKAMVDDPRPGPRSPR